MTARKHDPAWDEAHLQAGRQLEHASLTLQAFFADPRHRLLLDAFVFKRSKGRKGDDNERDGTGPQSATDA